MSDPVVVCDLDGVLWRGDHVIPGAADGVQTLRDSGLRVVFVSNNSGHRVGDIVDKLHGAGVDATADDVLTSAHAAARLLQRSLAPGSRVFVCAGAGVVEALEAADLTPVRDGPADAVVVGFHRDFDFDELHRAARTVRDGARFIAANLDATYPVPDGLMPGSGAIAAAVAVASGVEPEVAGKPEAPTVALVRERWGDHGVVVGDRPSSDGALADALGWPFALVLSGVTGSPAPPGGEPIPDPPPAFVAADLGVLAPDLARALASRAPVAEREA